MNQSLINHRFSAGICQIPEEEVDLVVQEFRSINNFTNDVEGFTLIDPDSQIMDSDLPTISPDSPIE